MRLRLALIILLIFAATSVARADAPRFRLHADQRPIRDFLREVAEITGKNIVVDPGVDGTVTLISPAPLTREEVWNVALSALDVNGFTAVEFGPVVKIVSKDSAATQPIPLKTPDVDPGESFATDVIELEHIGAQEAAAQVGMILSEQEKVAATPGRNAVAVIASEAKIQRVRELLARLDVPDAALAVEVIPLEYASAVSIAEVLKELFAKSGGTTGRGCRCVFTVEPRANALVVRAPAGERAAAKALVRKLDRDSPTIAIAALRNMNAEEARDLLQSLTAGR